MTRSRIIFLRFSNQDSDYICQCPECGATGPLMTDFSWLESGFNGIKRGDPDDVDLQECGNCAARLEWDMPSEEELGHSHQEVFTKLLDYIRRAEQQKHLEASSTWRERPLFRALALMGRWLNQIKTAD